MPSPFPGMDPYLESRTVWPDLHQSMITYSRDALRPRLRPRYHAHNYLTSCQPWHYLISISRAGHRDHFEVYPLTLRQRLPRTVIPLVESDSDTVLDLQAVFDRCYENGAYADLIDYRAEPEIPLGPDDAAWADELLRQKGFRPGGSTKEGRASFVQ